MHGRRAIIEPLLQELAANIVSTTCKYVESKCMSGAGRDLLEDEPLIVAAFNTILAYAEASGREAGSRVSVSAYLSPCAAGQWLDSGWHGIEHA